MVIKSNVYGVRLDRSWCERIKVLIFENNGQGVRA
jgi:hypothetical protein